MGEKEEDSNGGVEILYAEDSPTQAEQLRYLLERQGYRPLVASDGRRALAIARERRPALVIADILMPEMDGYELCRQIKADKDLRDIPVILLTSLSDANDVLEALKCGANNFLTKPYDPAHLLSRIQYILTNRDLLDKDRMRKGLEITLGGARHHITAERQQIFDFLLSTYESYSRKNEELNGTAEKLRRLNEVLEERVVERTAALMEEIEERKQAEQALRESERKYRVLVANAGEAIFIAQDETVKFPNPKTLEMTGYSAEELASTPFTLLIHPEDRGEVLERYIGRLHGGLPREPYPFRVLKKTGEEIWALLIAEMIDWEGRPGVLCFLRDITRERNLEAQFRQAQKMEAVGRLAGGIAHDFNNLLTVTIGYCDLALTRIGASDPLRHDLEEIRKASD
ncbi:MAG: response regulator, partial [bacterium]|nr:response regulator [bacterium]